MNLFNHSSGTKIRIGTAYAWVIDPTGQTHKVTPAEAVKLVLQHQHEFTQED